MHKTLTTLTLALAALSLTAGLANAAVFNRHPGANKKPSVSVQRTDCADSVGFLRAIKAAQIEQMGIPGRVYLIEMCAGEDNFSALFANGNASGLRHAIAQNEVLASSLYAKDFEPRDVFGISMGANDSVYLYVHKSGY